MIRPIIRLFMLDRLPMFQTRKVRSAIKPARTEPKPPPKPPAQVQPRRRDSVKTLKEEDAAAIAFATSRQMGLRRADAERLLQRVKSANPNLNKAEELLPEMLRLYSAHAR